MTDRGRMEGSETGAWLTAGPRCNHATEEVTEALMDWWKTVMTGQQVWLRAG